MVNNIDGWHKAYPPEGEHVTLLLEDGGGDKYQDEECQWDGDEWRNAYGPIYDKVLGWKSESESLPATQPAPAPLPRVVGAAAEGENPLAVVGEVLDDWLAEIGICEQPTDDLEVGTLFGMLGTAGYSIVPNQLAAAASIGGGGAQYDSDDVRSHYMRLITPLVRLNDADNKSLALPIQLEQVEKFWQEYRDAFDGIDENTSQAVLDASDVARIRWSNIATEVVPELVRVLRLALAAASIPVVEQPAEPDYSDPAVQRKLDLEAARRLQLRGLISDGRRDDVCRRIERKYAASSPNPPTDEATA